MDLTITSVDYCPPELHDQTPIKVRLLRELPGDDRPDYWLGELRNSISWIDNNIERTITHIIVAARWEGTQIEPKAENLPVGIAYVIDQSLLNDQKLDFEKCRYVAIGLSSVSNGSASVKPLKHILAGRIGRFFGVGNQ